MRSISERDLAVVIPLLAGKVRELTDELWATDELAGELTEERCQLQEILQQYDGILDSLRAEYESALAEGIRLPSYEELTRSFELD